MAVPESVVGGPVTPADQQGRARTIAAAVIVLLIFLTPAVGFFWLRAMSREAAERGVLSHGRDMLLRHMARTRGEWPQSWDDLAEDFDPADASYDTPSRDAMEQMVEIDFGFDPAIRLDDDRPPLRVIWLKERPDTEAVAETNARLEELLRQRQSRLDGQ